ncbi:penicillin-binding protein 1C [Pararhodospirillum photometricum]|uniref:penicillin-binding protein 1C n=1 Tax=Pararhodospirillum photometricum TaxID=1084 RepID=UPI001F588126|nr:penicillin-binding protein 1C [Pararhodospirillum photometricum]
MRVPPRTQSGTGPRQKRRTRRRWRVLAGLGGGLVGALAVLAVREGPPPLTRLTPSSVVLAADGSVLRPFLTRDTPAAWRLPTAPDTVDPLYLRMLIAIEDRRFAHHIGVDPLALARALGQRLTRGRVVSGASTLSMQTARLLDPQPQRTLATKAREMVRALHLEARWTKDQILAAYLTLAPFGGNLEGVRAGALAWLGKEPRGLTPGQAALLVALPRSPEALRPDRHPEAARQARDRVLDRLEALEILSPTQAAEARAEPLPHTRLPLPRLAPHLTERLARAHPPGTAVRTTVDAGLQRRLEALARESLADLGPAQSLAVMAVASATGRILASVGSPDDLAPDRAGAIDMTQAVRSPGSTLKPLIYGMAFERRLAHPESIITDRPMRFGAYTPSNFDDTHWGEVTLRDALAQSLNVPAVMLLDRVGPLALAGRLAQIGIPLRLPAGSTRPGLPLALGGLGLTLEELVGILAAIDAGGQAPRPSALPRPAEADPPSPLLDPVAAWQVADILAGSPVPPGYSLGRGGHAGRRLSYKTGTSYGYRDAWALGFDGAVTLGVWVGRPDGSPSPGAFGRGTALPILFRAFERLDGPVPGPRRRPDDPFAAPTRTGDLPPPLRRLEGMRPRFLADPEAPRVVFPPDGATLDLKSLEGPLVLSARGGRRPLVWLVDGRPLATPAHARQALWIPPGPGAAVVTVVDALGRSHTARVWLALPPR